MGAGHVAYRVAACFAGGQADFHQPSQDGRHVGAKNFMELDSLTRRDMRQFVGGEFFGDVGDAFQLERIHIPPPDLDADHVAVLGTAYAVDAVIQTEAAEIIIATTWIVVGLFNHHKQRQ